MRWLLCDYGNVLCLDQPEADQAGLAATAGLDAAAFAAAYWRRRDDYDQGILDAATYWAEVCPDPLDPDRLARLVALDIASWTHPAPASLAAVDRLVAAGARAAVLSNAPVEIARAADDLPWLAGFAPRLFSCDLGVIKPSPAAFAAALERLGATAGEVVFVDDREVNVEGARACGIEAVCFSDAAQLDALAPRLSP